MQLGPTTPPAGGRLESIVAATIACAAIAMVLATGVAAATGGLPTWLPRVDATGAPSAAQPAPAAPAPSAAQRVNTVSTATARPAAAAAGGVQGAPTAAGSLAPATPGPTARPTVSPTVRPPSQNVAPPPGPTAPPTSFAGPTAPPATPTAAPTTAAPTGTPQPQPTAAPTPAPTPQPTPDPTAPPIATPTPAPPAPTPAPPTPTPAPPPPSGFTCTLFIGYSQTNNWYWGPSGFEWVVDDQRYELLYQFGGAIWHWADPSYAGWSNGIGSRCASSSSSPDRIVLDVTEDFFITASDVSRVADDIRGAIATARSKFPSVRQVWLQPVVGGPHNTVCSFNGNPSDPVRASSNHPFIDQAIAQVAGGTVVAGPSPEVLGCGDYADDIGHLLSPDSGTIGRNIGAWYNAH